jgi:probable F420-dependent oxidoreductase
MSLAAITEIAQEAERQDFASLWTLERLLYPRYFVPYGNNTQGIPVPEEQRSSYDPLETLTYVAAKTEHIKLGTSVIDVFFHAPMVLARRLTTLDHFSGGRLIAGIGRGWMKEEYEATNTPFERQRQGLGEYVKALRAIWGPDPVHYEGLNYTIANADIDPKPIQAGGPPLFFGTNTPASIKLAARLGDGLNPLLYTWEMAEMVAHDFPEQVRRNGRDPSQMEIIPHVVGNGIAPRPLPEPRVPLTGSLEQISEDLQRLEELGIGHVAFDLAGMPIAERLQQMEQLRRAAADVSEMITLEVRQEACKRG